MEQKWLVTTRVIEGYESCFDFSGVYLYRLKHITIDEKLTVLKKMEEVSEQLDSWKDQLDLGAEDQQVKDEIISRYNQYIYPEIIFKMNFEGCYQLEYIDVFNLLFDLKMNWHGPQKEFSLIEQYDSQIEDEENVLFHNMRQEYILIGSDDLVQTPINLFFLGVTLKNGQLRMKIKAFTPEVLLSVVKKIEQKFKKAQEEVRCDYDSLQIVMLKNIGHRVKKEFRDEFQKKFLEESLKPQFCDWMEYIFSRLEDKGYLVREDFECEMNGGKLGTYKQLTGFFYQYLKLNVENRFVLLHQEVPRDFKEVNKNMVFSFPARLYQYFLSDWFEDYFESVLIKLGAENGEYQIKNILKNYEFTFGEGRQRELDMVFEVRKDQQVIVVGVDCKKTLSKATLNKVKDKTENNILSTEYYGLIDLYLTVGYFASKSPRFLTNFDADGFISEKVGRGTAAKEMISLIGKSYHEFESKLITLFERLFS